MSPEDLYKHAFYYDALIKMIQFYDVIFEDIGLDQHQGDDLRHGKVGFVGLDQLTKPKAVHDPNNPEHNLLLQMKRCDEEAAQLPDDY